MRERGQITIEAILLFGIFVTILFSISLPMAMKVKKEALEVSTVADARYTSEQIVTAANSIAYPGGRRTLEVYVPGDSEKNINTTISTDGSNLITTVLLPGDGPKVINLSLYGKEWVIYDSGGNPSNITENQGARYKFIICWKNITFTRLG